MMKPACALHRKAQASPKSAGSPIRPAGIDLMRSLNISSALMPRRAPIAAIVVFCRSVEWKPGSRLLMVTLSLATCRAIPAQKPVRPVRAPFDKPSTSIGCFTAPEVMFTMRPNFCACMLSMVRRISSIGASMLASSALIHSSRRHSRKSPAGGPPALVTRMSGLGHAAKVASRPASVVMSPATAMTFAPVAARISAAAASSASAPRAVITSSTPSRANDMAQALPSPLLAAHTMALRPRIPSSIDVLLSAGG